jgi:hypothetical protein
VKRSRQYAEYKTTGMVLSKNQQERSAPILKAQAVVCPQPVSQKESAVGPITWSVSTAFVA